MSKTRVVCLEAGGGSKVKPAEIEQVIGQHAEKGWRLAHITTGGGGDRAFFTMWVYLVFQA